MRVRFGNVVMKGESGGDLLGLLKACVFFRYPCFGVCRVSGCLRLLLCRVWGFLGVCVWYCMSVLLGGLGTLLCA